MLGIPSHALLYVTALLAASPVVAKDVRTIHLNYVYYDVSGTTLDAIRAELNAKSPPAANGYVSSANFYYGWNFAFSIEPDAAGVEACRVYNASVSIDIDVVLPRHSTIAEAPPDVQASWTRFIAATKKHELRHVADFAETGFGLLDALAAVTAPDCDATQKQADAIGQDFHDRALKLGLDYDVETNHGINDGAILR